ncbi:MAG: tRNA (adenosine(37)-N6)-dimethylallyltransferase MiaA [Elusimicrobia bacterium]|nr:tRNA (adenosine(37)-N6)-dimethylallyltransferase MiaA [Elusimicrobiota bacterium]
MNDVLVVTGPTASGKTKLAHLIALNTGAQIIVADSMKVYRGADIGTSKPPAAYRDEVKYHLVDTMDAMHRYNVGIFVKDAMSLIDSLHGKGILPVVLGGTGLYISKLIEGLAEIPAVPEELKKAVEREPVEKLYEELQGIDPARAAELHPNMKKRIVRAVAVFRHTGKRMSEYLQDTEPADYNFIVLNITWDRDLLYERINQRVDRMVREGMLEEARELYGRYGHESPVFEGLGYRQLLPYLETGEGDIDEYIDEIKKATRNYAKSQLTWWRKKSLICLDGKRLQECGVL